MLSIVSYTPSAGAIDQPLNPLIKITFSDYLDPDLLTKSYFLLYDIYGNPVERVISYDSNTKTVSIQPIGLLNPYTDYTISVKGSDGLNTQLAIKALNGSYLDSSLTIPFQTGNSIDQSIPAITEQVQAGFQRLEGYNTVKTYIAEETGEPTVYIESSASTNYSGELINTPNGPLIYEEGIYQVNKLPEKTLDSLEIIKVIPTYSRFSRDTRAFIVYFNDTLEAYIRDLYGMALYGTSQYEDFQQTMQYYFELTNYVPFNEIFNISGDYHPIEYDLEYIPNLNAMRFNITNPSGWYAPGEYNEPDKLDYNTVYTLHVRSGLEGLTTQPLKEDLYVHYLTDIYPAYCDLLSIKSVTQYIDESRYTDQYIKLLIFRASLIADELITSRNIKITDIVKTARKNYTCCLVKFWLLTGSGLSSGQLNGISESLGDYNYEIRSNTPLIKSILDDIQKCLDMNEQILLNGGLYPKPNWAERARYDYRKPDLTRWPWMDNG